MTLKKKKSKKKRKRKLSSYVPPKTLPLFPENGADEKEKPVTATETATETPQLTAAQIEHTQEVMKSCVLLKLRTSGVHGIAGRRKANVRARDEEGHSLDEDYYLVSQLKIDRKYVKDVLGKITEMQSLVKRKGLEFPLGDLCVPLTQAPSVLAQLRVMAEDVRAMWKVFCAEKYPEAVDKAEKALGKAFRRKDYPSAQWLYDGLRLTIQAVTISVPDTLKNLDETEFQKQQQEMAQVVNEFQQWARDELRYELQEVLSKAVEQLRTNSEGKGARVTEALVRRFNDLFTRVKELAFLANERGKLFCPRNGNHDVSSVSLGVANDTPDAELPRCPHCDVQLARATVTNYVYRIQRFLEGFGIDVSNTEGAREEIKDLRSILSRDLGKMLTEATGELDLTSAARHIKRRKRRASADES